MAMAGEALQGWSKLEDKLASKLSQLTKLLHHFSALPPECSEGNDDEIAGRHESEIHEILNETASRIRQFKTSLEIQIRDNLLRDTVRAMTIQHEAIQRATLSDLRAAESRSQQLEKTMQEREVAQKRTINKHAELSAREMMVIRSELLTKAEEFEKAKITAQHYLSEIQQLKQDHHAEMEEEVAQREEVQKQLESMTQRHQERVMELNDIGKQESERHRQALEELECLHKSEIERQKSESFAELEKLSRDYASREAEWHAKELELQNKITTVAMEKMQIILALRTQVQEGASSLEALDQALAKEKELTTKLRTSLNQVEEENKSLRENLKAALSSNDRLSIALETMKQEALCLKSANSSAVSEWECKADRLRQDLANMTNTCAASENDVKSYRLKVDELTFQLVGSRKELSLMVMEMEQLRREMQKSNLDISAKEEEIRRIQSEAELKNRTLTAEVSRLQLESIAQIENSSQKMKEMLESRKLQQIQAQERSMQNLEKSFLTQLEEQEKGTKLQLESLEGIIRKQREEETRAKEACAQYRKTLQVVEQKLEEQESKALRQIQTYENQVVELTEKLEVLEGTGLALEDEFTSLLKQVMRHTQQSRQVGSIQQEHLQEVQKDCGRLQNKLNALTKEYEASTMRYEEEVHHLKEAMTDQDRAHRAAISAESDRHAAYTRQSMNDMQRLNEEHSRALAEGLQAHEMEMRKLSSELQEQKDAEIVKLRVKLDSCLQRNKVECHEEMELMTLKYEKTLRDLRDALHTAEIKQDRLARAHLNAIKTHKQESKEELKEVKQASKEALAAANAVSLKLKQELDAVQRDYIKQLQHLSTQSDEKVSAMEEEWTQRFQTMEEDWKDRLQSQEAMWSLKHTNDLKELHKSLAASLTEEKHSMEADYKREVCKLTSYISELETLAVQKDDRIRGLLQVITKMEESSRVALLELKSTHKQHICDMLNKQRVELKELQKEGTAMIEELRTKHTVELESLRQDAEKIQVELQAKLEKLQRRFDNRESRADDVARIMKLQELCAHKDTTIQKLHDKASQLRLELGNREETYNRLFGNSPTVQQGVSDWLRPKPKTSETVKVDSSKLKVESSNVDIVKLQKRAASARRINKGSETSTRSASTLR